MKNNLSIKNQIILLTIDAMNKILILTLLCLGVSNLEGQNNNSRIFDFEFEGNKINGVLNMPQETPKGIVIIVHGSGKTNAVDQDWYLDVRQGILNAGYATYMWDKMGCGKSEGTFDYNQSVQNSSSEVIAAINTLKKRNIPGTKNIGLWGISRAGWINPLVINQYNRIKFWISVSGVDDKENFKYLLKENLEIDGVSKDSVNLIVDEYMKGTRITHSGGKYDNYLNATKNLQKNDFWTRFMNGGVSEEHYYLFQKKFMDKNLDDQTGLQIYIDDFDNILSNVDCPVLALFGEADKNVDWRKTKKLYQETLGKNTDLTIKSFPNCNHNLFKCKTGGFYEIEDDNLPWDRCEGFIDSITIWLNMQAKSEKSD